MRRILMFGLLLVVTASTIAQDETVRDTLRRFDQAKPTEEAMRFYSLDGVCSLEQAKQRAKAEHRYILLILNTFPKHNPQGQVVERIRMTAAIELRPE